MFRQTTKLDGLIKSLIPKLPKDKKMMIYGAYGYSGELICRIIKHYEKDLLPFVILAGRSQTKLDELAKKYSWDYSILRCFDVNKHFDDKLEGISVLLNAAGPFAQTFEPVVQACLRVGISYLDITGEFPVLEAILTNNSWKELAAKKNIYLIPAVAFDVVPSDCLFSLTCSEFEKQFKEKPERMEAAMVMSGEPSHGTAKTMVSGLGSGFHSRVNGKIIQVPPYQTKPFQFSDKSRTCMNVPWGDISTAFHSTQVPNISVYFADFAPRQPVLFFLQLTIVHWLFMLIFKLPFVVPLLQKLVEVALPKGPSDEKLNSHKPCEMVAIATKNEKQVRTRLYCSPGYVLTAHSGIVTALKVLCGDVKGKPGACTPSQAFGEDYILHFDESKFEVL